MAVTLRCERCFGVGRSANGRRCLACGGVGAAVQWGDTILTWSLAIHRAARRGRRCILTARALIALALFLIASIGAMAFIFAGPYADTVNRVFGSLARPRSGAVLLFWFGLLAACSAVVQFVRARERAVPVPPTLLAAADVVLTVPVSLSVERRFEASTSFDAAARTVLERAATIAEKLEHPSVLPIHCFAAISSTACGAALFGRLGVASEALQERIERALASVGRFAQDVRIAPETTDVCFRAYTDAARFRRRAVGVLDLLLALAEGEDIVRAILDDLAIDDRKLTNVAVWLRVRDEVRARYRQYRRQSAFRPKHGMNRAMTAIATPILDAFGEDLTQLAAVGALGVVIDREREFSEIFRVFESGRNGVILVGEPGVGKSAIIEGLAEKMAADDVPKFLQDKRLVRLSVPHLTSGVPAPVAQERLLAVLHEVERSRNIVLVVDHFEHLVSAGDVAISFGDIIATEFERSGLVFIGAATPMAYQQYVERSALGATLERVAVTEPEGDAAIQIAAAQSILIEARQRTFFSYDALETCVTMARRYLRDKNLPEAAVALMEETAIAVRTARGENQIISREDVARLIEEKTGIPAREVGTDEASKLLHLEERMHERVVGQDEAIQMVAAALRRARLELREGKRPIAAFLFLGPTGVGKTEVARTLAETYFGAEEAMVRFDMSEFRDPSSIQRLIGAPPGYTGSEAGGQLTEAIRRKPFTLVLLDEFEKAHPDVRNLFLQVFEDGRLTDSAGRTVDFADAIIIATSNAGTPYIQSAIAEKRSVSDIRDALLASELRSIFPPELLNRFDGVIVFTPLTRTDIFEIAKRMIARVGAQLEAKGIIFRATDAAIAELAAAGFDPQFGARPLRRVIQERVQDALATFLLQQKIGRRDTVIFDTGGKIRIEKAAAV
ncbi:MAG: ATP-dependent Clp protease ATP-binding subunit, partial [Candidatus Uhrbacteria bacterium]